MKSRRWTPDGASPANLIISSPTTSRSERDARFTDALLLLDELAVARGAADERAHRAARLAAWLLDYLATPCGGPLATARDHVIDQLTAVTTADQIRDIARKLSFVVTQIHSMTSTVSPADALRMGAGLLGPALARDVDARLANADLLVDALGQCLDGAPYSGAITDLLLGTGALDVAKYRRPALLARVTGALKTGADTARFVGRRGGSRPVT